MSIEVNNIITASDMNTAISNINKTLAKYSISTINSVSQNYKCEASTFNNAITYLLQADSSSHNYNPNAYKTTLNNNKVSAGYLIKSQNITTVNSCATGIYNNYCSCNCNNCCSCQCNNCCPCQCNNCCSCNSDVKCYCQPTTEYC